jgi:hypothetical protein
MKRVIYTEKVARGLVHVKAEMTALVEGVATDEDKQGTLVADVYAALDWVRYQERLKTAPRRKEGAK